MISTLARRTNIDFHTEFERPCKFYLFVTAQTLITDLDLFTITIFDLLL